MLMQYKEGLAIFS